MRRVFISYHHANDQWYKDQLQQWARQFQLFEDISVNTREVDDNLPTERIRCIIRDDYLRDSTVTLVLVGTGTKGRKFVDWEIYSSMFDGSVNKKSGVLVIQLPTTGGTYITAAHSDEKTSVFSDITGWTSVDDRTEYERRYPYLPDRIIDNLLEPKAKVSVTTWDRITSNLNNLSMMIEAAHNDRASCDYDLSRPMRTNNSPAFI
jgi:hypothetical protein